MDKILFAVLNKGRICLTQLLDHFYDVFEPLTNKADLDSILYYLDYAKAFDKVDHNLLLRKLKSLGVKGRLGIWIQFFLKNRCQQVLVDGKLLSNFTLVSGVPQGFRFIYIC